MSVECRRERVQYITTQYVWCQRSSRSSDYHQWWRRGHAHSPVSQLTRKCVSVYNVCSLCSINCFCPVHSGTASGAPSSLRCLRRWCRGTEGHLPASSIRPSRTNRRDPVRTFDVEGPVRPNVAFDPTKEPESLSPDTFPGG